MTEDDEKLVVRLRTIMSAHAGYSEKTMFGGRCFFVHGNMCVGPWKGSLIVRLEKSQHEQTQAEEHAHPMDMTGKVMKGWARIAPEGIRTKRQLQQWVNRAIAYVETLPAK